MGTDQDLPTFDGNNGVTCEAFIRVIRRYSLSEGKEKDDYWIALTAATCLNGSALRWYEGLDDETQESWKLLRRAILVRWPAAVQVPNVLEIQAHTPILAATSPVPAPSPPSLLPQISSTQVSSTGSTAHGSLRIGRIKVVSESTSPSQSVTFIASKLNPRGFYETTGSIADALVIQFDPSKRPHEIYLQSEQGTRIGILWFSNAGGGSEQEIEDGFITQEPFSVSAALTPMTPGRTGWQLGVHADYQGIPRTITWNVMINGAIVAFWETPTGALYPADFAVAYHQGHDDDGVIQVSNSFQPPEGEKRVWCEDYNFEQVVRSSASKSVCLALNIWAKIKGFTFEEI